MLKHCLIHGCQLTDQIQTRDAVLFQEIAGLTVACQPDPLLLPIKAYPAQGRTPAFEIINAGLEPLVEEQHMGQVPHGAPSALLLKHKALDRDPFEQVRRARRRTAQSLE